NLRQDLNLILTELAQTPRDVVMGGQTVSVDRSIFLNALRNAFYSRESTAWLPLAITEFAAGNTGPWRAMGDISGEIMSGVSLGTMLSVMCGEEVPRMLATGVATTTTAFEHIDMSFWPEACDVWPAARVENDFDEPVSSDVPVLLLSGAMDPVTPPAFANVAQATLTRSRHLVAAHNAHITSNYSCAPQLIGEFLDTLDPDALDDTCLNRVGPAPFLLTPAGPSP
ncbi:MAG: alpha/beta hydrolase, partial [Gammaproteobacteria bacterium]